MDWLLFIDNPDSEYAKLAENSVEVIGRAKDMLRTLSADEKLREEYLAREKGIMDHYASLKAAENFGREEERTENNRKMKMAMNVLPKQGISVENIALAYQM